MMRSLFSGVAGLRTHQSKMDVIGNNIANVNTVGFKSSAVTFQDIMYQTTSGASGATQTLGGVNAKQTGLGVTSGATKILIEQGGAAQSTGQAFDLRFTDQSSTNFFIVSNGSSNLFTRAGTFYIDGAGNLAMTTTGYMVMGWQYNEETASIRRDTVSPLRIMAPENRTSTPEWTTDIHSAGVLDKNNKDIVSESGYVNSLTVYDNLGYAYTVRFSTRLFDGNEQQYTTKLDSIKDANGNDILANYISGGGSLSDVFGDAGGSEKVTYDITNKSRYPLVNGQVTYTTGGKTYYMALPAGFSVNGSGDVIVNFRENPDGTGNPIPAPNEVKASSLYGIDNAKIFGYISPGSGATLTVNGNGQLTVEYPATNYKLNFDKTFGTLVSAGNVGGTSVMLNLSVLGDAFSNVNVNYASSLAYDNGAVCTFSMDRGQLGNITLGAGRKLGALTGLSVSQDGTIWGSYDNGTNRCLGQIPVARFANASGLESLGNNCYATTRNSGDFDGIGVDVTADGGKINSGQLEMSNVDLSQEFTDMITTQRGFQANSRIITVSDTMLEELTNLKR